MKERIYKYESGRLMKGHSVWKHRTRVFLLACSMSYRSLGSAVRTETPAWAGSHKTEVRFLL